MGDAKDGGQDGCSLHTGYVPIAPSNGRGNEVFLRNDAATRPDAMQRADLGPQPPTQEIGGTFCKGGEKPCDKETGDDDDGDDNEDGPAAILTVTMTVATRAPNHRRQPTRPTT